METNKKEFENLGNTVRLWIKNWKWFALSVFVFICLGVLYILSSHVIYRVEASVVISEGDKSGMSAMMGDLSDVFGSGGIVDDEVYKLSAHSVYVQVAKDLNLCTTYNLERKLRADRKFEDSPLQLKAIGSIADTLSTGLDFKVSVSKNEKEIKVKGKANRSTICDVKATSFPVEISTPYGKFILDKTEFYNPAKNLKMNIGFCSYDAAAEAISQDVKVYIATKKANVIMLNTKTSCVPYSIALLDKIVEVYNLKGILERNREGRQTLDFINSRLEYIEKDLETSESEVEDFKNKRNITDLSVETGIQTNYRVGYEQVLNAGRLELELLNMTEEFLSNPKNTYDLIPTTPESGAVNEGIKKYNELILKRMEIAHNAKEGNVTLNMLDNQIASIRENILSTIKKTRENKLVAIEEAQSHLNKAYGKLSNVPSQEREYRDLLRQKNVREQLYTLLLKNREETAMMIANATPRGIIIDEAFAYQRPVSIGKGMTLVIAFILGLVFPAIFFMIRPIFRNKFENRTELQSLTKTPILGELTLTDDNNPIVVRKGSYTVINELFTNLRTNLGFLLGKKDHNVVVVTSTSSGEGKSFVSINLAASLSLLNKKVILVGMDIRKPRLAQYLNLQATKGVTDYLVDTDVVLDKLVVRDSEIPFDIICAGPVPPNPAELLSSDRVSGMIADLKKEYDYVIIDSAPIGAVSDSFSILPFADAIIYVTRANVTTFDDIRFFNETVAEKSLKNIAIVINGTKKKAGYGYGYGENIRKKKKFMFFG